MVAEGCEVENESLRRRNEMFIYGVLASVQNLGLVFLFQGPHRNWSSLSNGEKRGHYSSLSQLLEVPPLIITCVHILFDLSLTSVFLAVQHHELLL